MTDRNLGVTIDVRRDVIMFHTVLVIDHSKRPIAVAITTNPLEHRAYAQVVMHKSRSHGCSIQVARYVRRTFGIDEPVATHRATRPVEAKIGFACAGGMQHAPDEATPGWGVFQHIAETPIKRLLEEVADGLNVARTRYVVYEVRTTARKPLRGVTHRFAALERRYREAPPDTFWPHRADLVQVGRCASHFEAINLTLGFDRAHEELWTRKPDPAYVRDVLKIVEGEIVWTCDGSLAVRTYDFDAVCIGPHVYMAWHVRHVLEHGSWPPDGRTLEGRRLLDSMA